MKLHFVLVVGGCHEILIACPHIATRQIKTGAAMGNEYNSHTRHDTIVIFLYVEANIYRNLPIVFGRGVILAQQLQWAA
jgi:hypothetical protein